MSEQGTRDETDPYDVDGGGEDPRPRPRRRRERASLLKPLLPRSMPALPPLPDVPAWAAALATGLLAGLAAVLLTGAGMMTCDAVRGAPSCGGAGYPLVLLILVAVGIGAAFLLVVARVADAAVIAFISVPLVVTIVLLALMDVVFSAWMWAILPAVSAACFVVVTLAVHAASATPVPDGR